MLRELGFYGMLIPPILAWMCVALLVTAGLRHVFSAFGVYRFVWHRPLFDTALLVIVLGVVVTGSAWFGIL